MRRFWWLQALLVLVLLGGMGGTLTTGIGASLADYNVAFAVLLGAAAVSWPFLRRRRVATIAMALTGVFAVASGFAMLYTKQFPFKDWVTWWHSVTSFAFTLAFLVHWWRNHGRLMGLTRRALDRWRAALPLVAAWAAVALAFALTWAPAGRGLFTRDNYLHLSSWAVFGGVALAYGAWLVFRLPGPRAVLARGAFRHRVRGAVDGSLFLACWLSLLTGFALVYFADFLRGGDLKYVSKWWHTATSVALLAVLALHIGFNARLLAAHARRVDGELGGDGRGRVALVPSGER